MKCRCPACGRSTWVPEEQLDFLARCDRCRTLLLTRTAPEPSLAAQEVPVEIVPLTDVAFGLRESAAAQDELDLADFMTRRQSSGRHAIVSAPPASTPRPRTSGPGTLGATAYALILILAAFTIIAIIFVATRGTLRPATAARPAAMPVEEPNLRAVAPQPATAPAPEAPDLSTGDGELFPDVKPK